MIKKAAAEAGKHVSTATTGKTLKQQNFQNKCYWQRNNTSVFELLTSTASNSNDTLGVVWLLHQLPLVWNSFVKKLSSARVNSGLIE